MIICFGLCYDSYRSSNNIRYSTAKTLKVINTKHSPNYSKKHRIYDNESLFGLFCFCPTRESYRVC